MPEPKYELVVTSQLKTISKNNIRKAVEAVVEEFVKSEGKGLVVTSFTKNLLSEAIYGIKADPNPKWNLDTSNNKAVLQTMIETIASIPILLKQSHNELKDKITFSDLLHAVSEKIDTFCVIKKTRK